MSEALLSTLTPEQLELVALEAERGAGQLRESAVSELEFLREMIEEEIRYLRAGKCNEISAGLAVRFHQAVEVGSQAEGLHRFARFARARINRAEVTA